VYWWLITRVLNWMNGFIYSWYTPPAITRNYRDIATSLSLMELSPTWEAASCAATQELRRNLWSLQFHYCVHKSPPLVCVFSQIDPAPYYLWSTHLRLGLPSGIFSSGFPTNILYPFFLPSPHATFSALFRFSPTPINFNLNLYMLYILGAGIAKSV
jgi:hypothetical protein